VKETEIPIAARIYDAVRGQDRGQLRLEVFAPEWQEDGQHGQCRVRLSVFEKVDEHTLYGVDEFQALELAVTFLKQRQADFVRGMKCKVYWGGELLSDRDLRGM
jgi:hypothetical protein